mmetsp:Transcript_14127/g.30788  ORF Transcript_14127/g.30788 Transcript_14127/m.30788 type:complete len:87 (+) Transcript_14127:77-337(+)|eukprot:CAMPEP_0168733044 /NCGR_PEP_ID=MMETSP0724-20121128/8083_1 /TAXON_ID=265536 /ORGANISM="Amphiprora sp., Strain CCMP467" /LENGTH=86 /DNA_ID=CAMNT_0008780081 /DNA_START=73 /DNA_END=333 /DNA_ORIENTATION=-
MMIKQVQRLRERFDRGHARGQDTTDDDTSRLQKQERQEKVHIEVEELRDLEQRLEQEEEMKDLEEQWNWMNIQSRPHESTSMVSHF